jgi:hypothetical protein
MPAIGAFLEKLYLDFATGAATATQPAARWAALSIGTPTSVSASEMGTLTGYSRLTSLFGAAASPTGSASITAAMTFGPFSSVGSALGVALFDGSPVNSSDMLWYGTLATARTFGIGDTLIFAAGALTLTIS